jgi:hypothetical protein
VLRRGHAAAGQLRYPLTRQHGHDVIGIVVVQDHPVRLAQGAPDYGQEELGVVRRRVGEAEGRSGGGRGFPSAREEVVHPAGHLQQTGVTLLCVRPPDHEPMVCQNQTDGVSRNPSASPPLRLTAHLSHRLCQRETGPDIRDVHHLSIEQLGDQPLRLGVPDIGDTHGGHVVGVGDHPVGQQGVERRLHTGRGSLLDHTRRHEAHHLGVGHGLGVAQGGEFPK